MLLTMIEGCFARCGMRPRVWRLAPVGLAALFVVLGLTLVITPWAAAGTKYKVLHAFTGKADGGAVFAGVVLDQKGNLYGTTQGGGAYGYGTVFELTPRLGGKWTETILHNFCKKFPHCADGALPSTTLVLDRAGNLYGGSNSATFEMRRKAGGWTFLVLCDCVTPSVFDAAGSLYGIGGPGTHNAGAVVELSPVSGGWKETVLYSFCSERDCRDGEPPEWGLSWDSAGNIYGTTKFGGNSQTQSCRTSGGCGVVYELTPGANGHWSHKVLHRFGAFSGDGQLPFAGVTEDDEGNVYGSTLQDGGSGDGTVFELSPNPDGRWKETILYNFPRASDGGAPFGGVVLDRVGNLYGTTSAAGDPVCDCGTVFKLTRRANRTWHYAVLHRFTGKDGYGPASNLVFDKSYKHLYGTTAAGGSGGYGVVYEITP
jgi:uncharacterized repeat protein (TIGR03803 family)